jgi:hypothetical protein
LKASQRGCEVSGQPLIEEQWFRIDRSRDIRQQVLPIHRRSPQPLPSLLTLSMKNDGVENKSNADPGKGCNFQQKDEFEYLDL